MGPAWRALASDGATRMKWAILGEGPTDVGVIADGKSKGPGRPGPLGAWLKTLLQAQGRQVSELVLVNPVGLRCRESEGRSRTEDAAKGTTAGAWLCTTACTSGRAA